MRARALAVSLAVLLLAGTTAGAAAAAESGRLADSPTARVAPAPVGLGSLLPADQLAPTGPAQWYMPWLTGGAGSNYLGPGGWRSYQPFYGPFGPYPTLQTAAFYGATNSPLDPFTTQQLTFLLSLQNGNGLNGANLGALTQTGLAPLASANLNQLMGLGLGTGGLNAAGQLTFTFGTGGQVFAVPAGQNFSNVTLGQIVGQVPQIGFGGFGNLSSLSVFPGLTGLGGMGGFGFGGAGGAGSVGFGGRSTPTTSANAVGP